MMITAVANTAAVMWLGGLVDAMEGKRSVDWFSRAPLTASGLSQEFEWQPTSGGDAAARPTGPLLNRIAIAFVVAIALAYLLREVLQVWRRLMIQNVCTRMDKEMTVQLVSRLLRTDLTQMGADRIGSLHGRIHRSVEGFVKFIKLAFLDFAPAIFMAGFALWGAATKQFWVAVLMAGVIPVSLFITARQLSSQKGIRLALLRKRESLDGTVVEQLGGLEYIRAANTLPIELNRVEQAAEERRSMEFQHHRAMTTFESMKAFNEGLFYILMVAFSIFLAVQGQITVGSILAFSGLYLGVIAPLREVHRIIDDAHESSLRVGDLLQMLSQPLDDSYATRTLRPPQVSSRLPLVAAQDLTMEYRGLSGTKLVLDGVDLEVRLGETIGVAGPSGSGKSTWLKLLMRLIHPTRGRLFLGGEPIKAISRDDIGQLIGYVSQTPFVFSGTIAENIAYGCGDVSRDAIVEAARRANIHEDILQMPGQYEARVAERGGNLSGGQRQRLALARVFLKNPPILVLDEATSALDNVSEKRIQQAIEDQKADR
ncbi:MAG TPA: ABC transporter ATP-binding protein, partial [Pirellulaceae bacterium]|nr:ABC transporter ATP-binding protein [Pirellulaceae bacterium]